MDSVHTGSCPSEGYQKKSIKKMVHIYHRTCQIFARSCYPLAWHGSTAHQQTLSRCRSGLKPPPTGPLRTPPQPCKCPRSDRCLTRSKPGGTPAEKEKKREPVADRRPKQTDARSQKSEQHRASIRRGSQRESSRRKPQRASSRYRGAESEQETDGSRREHASATTKT